MTRYGHSSSCSDSTRGTQPPSYATNAPSTRKPIVNQDITLSERESTSSSPSAYSPFHPPTCDCRRCRWLREQRERASLLGRTSIKVQNSGGWKIWLFIIGLLVFWGTDHYINTDRSEVRDRIRREWSREVNDHKFQREQWAAEEEKHRAEEEERNRAGMFWAPLDPGKCTSYGTRRYQSILENIPEDYKGNRIQACMETVLDIHGKKVKPAYCEDLRNVGLRGTWNIDFNEPACTPWWGQYKEKACTARRSGLREIEQHLINFSPNEAYDWRDVCSKTPTSFGGRSFDGPHSCVNWGSYDRPKLFGYWRVADGSCS